MKVNDDAHCLNARVVLKPIASKPAPAGFCAVHNFRRLYTKPVGARLAREEAGTSNINAV